MDYEKMWKELKRAAAADLSMLEDPKTIIEYADIQRMAAAKLIQQTMINIEKKNPQAHGCDGCGNTIHACITCEDFNNYIG